MTCYKEIVKTIIIFSVLTVLSFHRLSAAEENSSIFLVSDGINDIELAVGIHPDGQINFVEGLDQLAPPPPPDDAFDARIIVANESYFTKFLDNTYGEKRFEFRYRSAAGNGPIMVLFNESDLLPEATYRIEDRFGGSFFSISLSELDDEFQPAALAPVLVDGFVLVKGYQASTSANRLPELPKAFRLHQNYPNPFNPTTNLPIEIGKSTYLDISVFSICGQKIQELFRGYKNEGYHVLSLNGSNLASGLYIVRVVSESGTDMIKINVIK